MRISLIVPNLNEAKCLPMFFSSLDHQTFRDFEVIIVDGGSKDGSISIAEAYGKAIIHVDRTRNIGYVRNVGAKFASGKILFHTSSDVYLEPKLLEKIVKYYEDHQDCVALTGRTFPLGTSIFAHLSYQIFDLLRYVFTHVGLPSKKFSPSGNFFAIKKEVFEKVGGFPEVQINEDGLLGQKLDQYFLEWKCKGAFVLSLYVGHNVKRFEAKGGLATVLFYIYVLGNMFPILKPLLNHIERRSAEAFASRSDLGGDLNIAR